MPSSFNLSAFGPGVSFFLEWFELLAAFFFTTTPNIRLLRNGVFVHQSFAFGCFNRGDSSLAVIHLAIVPEEIDLPQIAMQVLAAHVVIDADETAPNERMATFRSVNVNVATRIFLCAMAHRFVFSRSALLEPTIRGIFVRHQTRPTVNFLADRVPEYSGCHVSYDTTSKLPFSLYGAKLRSLAGGASLTARSFAAGLAGAV